MQVPAGAQNRHIYILKKRVAPITSDNCRELLLFGLQSPSPLLQLSSTVEQVIVKPSIIHPSHKKAFCCICSQFLLCIFLASLYESWVRVFIMCLFSRYVFHCCQTTKTITRGQLCCLRTSFDMLRICAVRHQWSRDRF